MWKMKAKSEDAHGQGGNHLSQLKCVVIGDNASGKTSMLASYAMGSILGERVPTLYDNFSIVEERTVKPNSSGQHVGIALTVVDTVNQEGQDHKRTKLYAGSNVILICVPVICRQATDTMRTTWLPELEHYAPTIPFVLVGTKADLRGDPETIESLGLHSIMSQAELSAFAKSVGARGYVECSAIEHVGLDRVMQKALEVAKAGHRHRTTSERSDKKLTRKRFGVFFKSLLCSKLPKDGSRVS